MSSEKMEELSIKELISSYNFIIPEIQREYEHLDNKLTLMEYNFI